MPNYILIAFWIHYDKVSVNKKLSADQCYICCSHMSSLIFILLDLNIVIIQRLMYTQITNKQ